MQISDRPMARTATRHFLDAIVLLLRVSEKKKPEHATFRYLLPENKGSAIAVLLQGGAAASADKKIRENRGGPVNALARRRSRRSPAFHSLTSSSWREKLLRSLTEIEANIRPRSGHFNSKPLELIGLPVGNGGC